MKKDDIVTYFERKREMYKLEKQCEILKEIDEPSYTEKNKQIMRLKALTLGIDMDISLLNQESINILKSRYVNNLTLNQIAIKYKMDKSTVCRRIKKIIGNLGNTYE